MHYSVCCVFVHYLSYLFGSFDDLVINVGDPQYQDNIDVEVIDKDPSYYVGSDVGALQRKSENMSFISKNNMCVINYKAATEYSFAILITS